MKTKQRKKAVLNTPIRIFSKYIDEFSEHPYCMDETMIVLEIIKQSRACHKAVNILVNAQDEITSLIFSETLTKKITEAGLKPVAVAFKQVRKHRQTEQRARRKTQVHSTENIGLLEEIVSTNKSIQQKIILVIEDAHRLGYTKMLEVLVSARKMGVSVVALSVYKSYKRLYQAITEKTLIDAHIQLTSCPMSCLPRILEYWMKKHGRKHVDPVIFQWATDVTIRSKPSVLDSVSSILQLIGEIASSKRENMAEALRRHFFSLDIIGYDDGVSSLLILEELSHGAKLLLTRIVRWFKHRPEAPYISLRTIQRLYGKPQIRDQSWRLQELVSAGILFISLLNPDLYYLTTPIEILGDAMDVLT
ncbi:MAG: hypothetical protein ACTSYO_03170 [Candidatus Ranarchaeia archaeon]